MPRIAGKIEYAGGGFAGSQMQATGLRTVQSELERAVSTFFRTGGQRIAVNFAGRTDAGVHAAGQVVHFDLSENQLQSSNIGWAPGDPVDLEARARIAWGLNGLLEHDLSVVAVQQVPDTFDARRSATMRTYVYRILNRSQRSAVLSGNHYFVGAQLDVKLMEAACSALLGTHDYFGFRSSTSDKSCTRCTVDVARILNLGEGKLEFWISANHFVYNMVRIIVGTLVEIGLGKRSPSAIEEALATKRRDCAGPTAPPWGLCLAKVEYGSEFSLFPEEFFQKPRSQENRS